MGRRQRDRRSAERRWFRTRRFRDRAAALPPMMTAREADAGQGAQMAATAVEAWDEWWATPEGRDDWLEPHPAVAALVPVLKARGTQHVLDLGCGVGRHALLFAEHGFAVVEWRADHPRLRARWRLCRPFRTARQPAATLRSKFLAGRIRLRSQATFLRQPAGRERRGWASWLL
jgi:SAM-dependent methyltransferase